MANGSSPNKTNGSMASTPNTPGSLSPANSSSMTSTTDTVYSCSINNSNSCSNTTSPNKVCWFEIPDNNTISWYSHGIACVTYPVVGGMLILLLSICCIGIYIVSKRKRRAKYAMNSDVRAGANLRETEMRVPIDLATGQVNQQETTQSCVSKSQSLSADKNIISEEIPKPYINKPTDNVYLEMREENKPRVPMLPPVHAPSPDKDILKSDEPTASFSTDCKNSSLVSSNKSAKLLTTDGPPPDYHAQPSKVKRTHSNEKVKRAQENSQQEEEEKDSPAYDDVVTTLEKGVHLQKQAACGPEEPRYHVLCDPNEEQGTEDPVTPHCYEKKAKTGTKEGEIPHKGGPAVYTPQPRKHEYEEILNVPTDSKKVSTQPQTLEDRYNVLSNQLERNPTQSGVVQEEPVENPTEDDCYSTARVHRLVPVGKPIGPLVTDHLYQALDQQKQRGRQPGSKDYDNVGIRHNTFSSSSANSGSQRSHVHENLMRTYSSTAQSLEKLDPMYDEPFKPQQMRSNSLTRVDIYNVDSLFDDPKYGIKPSSRRVFDDPTYSSQAAARQKSQTGSQATERHVSFSADTKTGVKEDSIEKSVPRSAAMRKTN